MLHFDFRNQTKLMKCMAVLLCVLFIATPFLAGSYVCTHVHHDCIGAECAVCEQLEICTNALQLQKALLVAIVVVLALVKVASAVIFKYNSLFRVPETLITLQVELLN